MTGPGLRPQPMNTLYHFIRGLCIIVGCVVLFGWLMYRSLRRSEDPGRLVVQWIVTAIMLALIIFVIAPIALESPYVGVPFLAAAGVVMGIIWAPTVADLVARPIVNLFEGAPPDSTPQPLYSMAEAKRKRGNYQEAAAEVERELEQFPNDYPGLLMLAEIQAEDLKDLAAAQGTIERMVQQEGHAPKNVAFALNRLADWHLKLANQPEAARRTLEWIPQLFPDTELAYMASQRLAHLGQTSPTESKSTRIIPLKKSDEKLGLREDFTGIKALPEDPAAVAAAYVQQLERFPTDNEAREKLALLYASHFRRLDLALEQLEQLVAQPGAPSRQVTHWLNLVADLQVTGGGDQQAARQALQRIIDRYPNSADAEKARTRIAYLGLEMKGQVKGAAVQLGTYEDNLGLKD
jgi:tetratricopeptide (TPR) repeat protein